MPPPLLSRLSPAVVARWRRVLFVVLGLVLGQFFLYGPSLLGRKILLPLDILAQPGMYLPRTAEVAAIMPHDVVRSDLVLQFETERTFVATELRAGRFPLWLSYQYAGVPLVWPRFSPFFALATATPSPVVLAWVQLLSAVVAGLGLYGFCRRVLHVTFWPAAFAAWCYPLTAFFVFWQGFPTCAAVYWFPWLLWAVDRAVRAPRFASVVGVSVTTALTLISGHIDVAGQALLTAGGFGLWTLWDAMRGAAKPARPSEQHEVGTKTITTAPANAVELARRSWMRPLGVLALGFALGFGLATPHLVPLLAHARTSARMERRTTGAEERPPAGLHTLPEIVWPDFHGTTRRGSLRLIPGNQVESAAAAYAGLLFTLVLAPLAWFSRAHRRLLACWLLLGVVGLSWVLNLPGFVSVLRLPALKLFSHNRLVFVTAFAVLVHAAIGLEVLHRGPLTRRRLLALPAVLLIGLAMICVLRAGAPPEPLATQVETAVRNGATPAWIRSLDDVAQLRRNWRESHYVGALLALIAAAAWVVIAWAPSTRRITALVVATLGLAELVAFAAGRSEQAHPSWYFPRLPLLEQIAADAPIRLIGYSCLPPTLSQTHGLADVRGYDSIDPAPLVDLLNLAADPRSTRFEYALTQWVFPRIGDATPGNVRLPPVLDLLGVKHIVFRGSIPAGVEPPLRGVDMWALRNPNALPRAFVPAAVEVISDRNERLRRMGSDDFNPRERAFVEAAVPLSGPTRGTAHIRAEHPTRVVIDAELDAPGLVVLADAWTPGWRATVNGHAAPVLRVDHAVRGVAVGAGRSEIVFRYVPVGFWLSVALSATIALALGVIGMRRRRAEVQTREPLVTAMAASP